MAVHRGIWTKGCGSTECVEVQFNEEWICQCDDPPFLTGCDSGACVEVQVLKTIVKIRDSKDPEGPVLKFDLEEWENFQNAVRRGVFD